LHPCGHRLQKSRPSEKVGIHLVSSTAANSRRDKIMIRIILPFHLRTLAKIDGEISLPVEGPITQRAILDALEARYPMLRGTVRDYHSGRRRPLIRFFACEEDHSDDDPNTPLPQPVADGKEPYFIIGAIAGG
jgi:molybdopterin synthase sulfur carrier subunit